MSFYEKSPAFCPAEGSVQSYPLPAAVFDLPSFQPARSRELRLAMVS